MKQGILNLFILPLMLVSFPAYADQQIDMQKIVAGVRIDPELNKADQEYKQALAKLSPDQRKKLDALDNAVVMTDQAQIDLSSKSIQLAACAKTDPTLEMTHGKMIQNFTFAKLDEMRESWVLFAGQKKKIEFIDGDLLNRHIEFARSLKNQMVTGMSNAVAKDILDGKDKFKCEEIKKYLESKYAAAYAAHAKQKPAAIVVVRDPKDQSIQACAAKFNGQFDDGVSLNISLMYVRDPNAQAPSLEFSARGTGTDHKDLKMQDAWMNFGALDTRFAAQLVQPSPDVLAGTMAGGIVVPVLEYLKNKKPVTGVKAEGWPKQRAFEADGLPPKATAKMATCVSIMTPALSDPLKKAGYALNLKDLD